LADRVKGDSKTFIPSWPTPLETGAQSTKPHENGAGRKKMHQNPTGLKFGNHREFFPRVIAGEGPGSRWWKGPYYRKELQLGGSWLGSEGTKVFKKTKKANNDRELLTKKKW